MARRRRRRDEEHPDERWLVTYADVLTLMFVLFMVLYSMSVVNTSKFEALKQSLSDALSASAEPAGPSVIAEAHRIAGLDIPTHKATNPTPETARAAEDRQLRAARAAIDRAVAAAGLRASVTTRIEPRGLVVRVATDGVLFDSGSARLRPHATRLLAPIAGALRSLPNPVRVEGHTDTRPISTPVHPSNWELSGARAAAVVRDLAAGGVGARRLQTAGFGPTRPVASNATDAGRAANRRVVVVVERLAEGARTSRARTPAP